MALPCAAFYRKLRASEERTMTRSFFGSAAAACLVFASACGESADTSSTDEEITDGAIATGAGGSGGLGYGTTGGAKGTGGATGTTGGSTGAAGGTGPVTGAGTWKNVTGNLAGMASECGNLGFVSAKPDIDMLIAGIAQKGLWSSTDGGATWTALGSGAGSDTITNRPTMVVYDPTTPTTFWEAGIYNSGGVYKTTDNGATFKVLGTTHHNDSVAVDFSDPARMTLLAGGHESAQTLWKSIDGGQNWTNIGTTLPAGSSFSSNAYIADAQSYVVGCGGFSGAAGTFRTTDGGATWASVSGKGATPAPLVASDGKVYWPILYNNGLLMSANKGATWTTPLTQWNTLQTVTLVELPDHRLAGISGSGNNVPDFVVISSDSGKTWKKVGPQIPFAAGSVAYSSFRKAFYVSHMDCTGSVPKDGIQAMDWDYTAN
jgi:hypothetical protein